MPEPAAPASDGEKGGDIGVTVLYFAMLREGRGRDAERVRVPAGTTAGELHRRLFDGRAEAEMPVLYAVDQSYVSAGTVLEDGCEVAFIPPLGGG